MKYFVIVFMMLFLLGCKERPDNKKYNNRNVLPKDVEIFEVKGAICIWKQGYKSGGLSCDFSNFTER